MSPRECDCCKCYSTQDSSSRVACFLSALGRMSFVALHSHQTCATGVCLLLDVLFVMLSQQQQQQQQPRKAGMAGSDPTRVRAAYGGSFAHVRAQHLLSATQQVPSHMTASQDSVLGTGIPCDLMPSAGRL